MKKQRILLITRNLPPLVGGMERLNWHMADELSKYAEVKVVGPTGAAAVKPKKHSGFGVTFKASRVIYVDCIVQSFLDCCVL